MHRKKQSAKEDKFACPNPSCGLVFSKPLKVKNVGSEDSQCYDACPRCLTAITVEESVPVIEAKPDATTEDNTGQEPIVNRLKEAKAKPSATVHCAHHLGYLSERSKNEKIPEDCIVCENIVQCMLKVVKG
ncbi:MAG TPA: hypothetical protein VEC97_00895 [Candidatus Acidoferrales bacterium]|nr:hypothetical protein [Candidatus Acidoferrales bacterium]